LKTEAKSLIQSKIHVGFKFNIVEI